MCSLIYLTKGIIMLFVEICNGFALYLYNDGSAVSIGVLDGEVKYFSRYDYAYMWALPF